MKTSELLKILKSHGCTFAEHGKNHDKYYSPITKQKFPVWRHAEEMAPGTVHEILKQAGIKA